MKKLLPLILTLLAIPLFAKTIYVSKTGNNSNSGTEAQPYLTISKAAQVAVAGDVVIISEGTYEELLAPANNGTPANPIVFKGKAGDKVIITAMEAINNWTLDQGNIYKANVSWDLGQDNMALHNDILMDLARWPNNISGNLFERDYLPGCNKGNAGGNETTMNYNGSEGNGHGTTIPHAGKWENGGSLHFYGGAGFLAWTQWVTTSTSNKINFNLQRGQNWILLRHHPGYTGHGIKKGEFFLQGIKEALDYKNEWFYNKDTQTLFVQVEDGQAPAPNTLRFRRRTQTINLNKNFIHVENLAVFGGAIDITGTDNKLYKVSSFYGNHTLNVINGFDSGRQSVLMRGKRNVLDQCEIGWGGGNGVYDKGEDNQLLNSFVHDFNYLGNYDCVLNTRGAKRGKYRNNTLTRAGKDVIQAYVDGGEYAFNDISNSMQVADDGGLLYTTNARTQKSSIHHNTFHDSRARQGRFKATGIYLDNDSKNWDVHHNIVWNTDWTNIQINWNGTNLNIFNNTFVKGSATMGAWHKAGTAFNNVKVWNNLTDKEAVDQQGNQESESTWEPQADKQNNLVSRESFLNYTNNNFQLKAGAQAINHGRFININGTNYTENSVGNPDAGAYEYGTAAFTTGIDWNINSGPSNTCYGLPGETCSGSIDPTVERIDFVSTPTNIEQASSIDIDVNYTVTENRDLVAVLNSPDGTWLGSARIAASTGAGSKTLTINLTSLPAILDNYKVTISVRPVGGDGPDNIVSKIANVNITEDFPDVDIVQMINPPTEVLQSQEFTFDVAYEASAERDIALVMSSPTGEWMGVAKTTVQPGTGQVQLTISLNTVPATAINYKFDATIRTVGSGYEDNTNGKEELIKIVLVTAINNSKSDHTYNVYPNPTLNDLTLSEELNWSLLTINGELISQGEGTRVPMNHLISGIYILRIGVDNIRIIKGQ